MNYVGVDVHKKYSVLCALDESGASCAKGGWKETHRVVLRNFSPVWKAQVKQWWKRVGTGA